MATIADYTDAATVAAALRLPPDTSLAVQAQAGAAQIVLMAMTAAGGVPFYPGMSLALDQYNPGAREVVQITGPATGTGPYTVPVTALANTHPTGAPVKECSAIQDVVAAASRMVDDTTFCVPGAYAQQAWTETVEGQATVDGRLAARVSGRNVTAVSALSWVLNPQDAAQVADLTAINWDDYTITLWPSASRTANGEPLAPPPDPAQKRVLVTVSYTAGYSPLPPDLARAATVLAARMFKEGDSGFSDTVGNLVDGTLTFKKGIPNDVALILRPWRRWS